MTALPVPTRAPARPASASRLRGAFANNPMFGLGVVLLAAIILAAIFAPLIAPVDPTEINFADKLVPPGAGHWFGTDQLGRDIFAQVLYGARTSLLVGCVAVVLSLAIGIPPGLLAGYFGGRVDIVVMRISDVFLAFPPLFLPIAITAALGPGLFNAMLALAVSWSPWYTRIMRASVLAVRSELYVTAARAMGIGPFQVIRRHVLPNALTPTLVQASMDFGYTILAAASLSFIGVGARPPAIEWGLMVSNARSLVIDYWWTATFPGCAIFLAVLAVNLIGDGLRDALDPRQGEQG